MNWGVLGPLLVTDDVGEDIRVPAGRLRTLLAVLLMRANLPVPLDEIVEVVWDGTPPTDAARTLRVYMTRLRRVLGPNAGARILTRSRGYLCQVDEDEFDLLRVETLCREARSASRARSWSRAAELLSDALGQWRGVPLADVASELLRARERPRLEQLRQQAIEDAIDARMNLHQHQQLIPQLRELTDEQPLREHLHAQLMRALARSGRRAEALDAYRRAHRTLTDQLGIQPGPELHDLHQRILAGDEDEPASDDGPGPTPAGAGQVSRRADFVVPRQLPAAARHFTGRHAELDTLVDLLASTDGASQTVVISAIDGMAGIGKTALAVHWAHLNADLFPDGQLYVNLRGFDASGSPVPATTAVRRFLEALAVPATRIPAEPDAQFDLYRSVVANRRMLIVLDNGRDTEQVRPLLPGTATCRVLVTSRNQLTGLIALDGAIPLTLDLLPTDEARELLTRRLGPERTIREQPAVDELIDLCARLPLALNIAAARAVTRPSMSLGTLAAELRDARRRLDGLSAARDAVDIRAVFSWSYNALSVSAARLLRLLGTHPSPGIGLLAAASLAGLDPDHTRQVLDELITARLLTEHPLGRYGLHDLLRTYAAEQAERLDSRKEQHQAVHRMLDHHLHTAYPAALLVRPRPAPFGLDPLGPGVTVDELSDRDQAFAWHQAELPGLHGIVAMATDAGFGGHAWQITWCWAGFLDARGHWRELAALSEIALSAARRCGDKLGQAFSHRWLGLVRMTLGSHAEAHRHLDHAHKLFGAVGDNTHQAITHHAIAMLLAEQHHFAAALQHEHQALELHRIAGNAAAQARALNAIGWYTANLGEHEKALAYCQEALDLARPLNSPDIEAATLDSLAYAYRHLGQHTEAIACYQRVVDLRQVTRDAFFLSRTLTALGETHHENGDAENAYGAWRQALHILDELRHPDAEQVRAKIHGLPAPRQRTE